ncbi:hypothetical protein Tco_0130335, partial [Tanacetum coccineum]
DYEWYKALKDSELKDEALRNKAIMEGVIDDDESSRCDYEDAYHDQEGKEYIDEHENEEERELCNDATRGLLKKMNTTILQALVKRHVEHTKKSFA